MRLFVTSEASRDSIFAYVLGRQPSDGVMLVDEQQDETYITVFLDGRYIDKPIGLDDKERIARFGQPVLIEKILRTTSIVKTLATYFDGDEEVMLTVDKQLPHTLVQQLQDNYELVFDDNWSTEQQIVKTAWELDRLEQAVSITKAVFNRFLPHAQDRLGATEAALRADLLRKAIELGAQRESFPAIVATGENSAIPHHVTGSSVISEGPLLIDMGHRVSGYCSDMTRTVWVGSQEGALYAEFTEILQIVRDAYDETVAAVKPGVSAKQIDTVAREYIADHGYGDKFTHSVGHGIGLNVHEAPSLSKHTERHLEKGMVVTVEPGIYLPGKFGVRRENDIVVA